MTDRPGFLARTVRCLATAGRTPLRYQQPGSARFVAPGCSQTLFDEPVHLDRIRAHPERSWDHRHPVHQLGAQPGPFRSESGVAAGDPQRFLVVMPAVVATKSCLAAVAESRERADAFPLAR